jgi:hypothetical protein
MRGSGRYSWCRTRCRCRCRCRRRCGGRVGAEARVGRTPALQRRGDERDALSGVVVGLRFERWHQHRLGRRAVGRRHGQQQRHLDQLRDEQRDGRVERRQRNAPRRSGDAADIDQLCAVGVCECAACGALAGQQRSARRQQHVDATRPLHTRALERIPAERPPLLHSKADLRFVVAIGRHNPMHAGVTRRQIDQSLLQFETSKRNPINHRDNNDQ